MTSLSRLLCLLLPILFGCGVDEFRNGQRVKSCSECTKPNQVCIAGHYCVTRNMPAADGGSDEDSGPAREPCTKQGATEYCYTPEDKSTAIQDPCRPGQRMCEGGFWGECVGERVPQPEQCNLMDDDCDGSFDEIGREACDNVPDVQGECTIGLRQCSIRVEDGVTVPDDQCLQVTWPQTDICNGKDDDCDGQTDEGTGITCYPTDAVGCSEENGSFQCTGTCQPGVRMCEMTPEGVYAAEESCSGATVPVEEECTVDGQSSSDEDCDGKTDEGCACKDGTSCYDGPRATRNRGLCKDGILVCSDATNGTCTEQTKPKPETCANEGFDDDCDGVVDNVAIRNTSCAAESTLDGACKTGAKWQCLNGQPICEAAPMGLEVCDGRRIDEDCDGNIDEDFDLDSDPNNCGACGMRCGGLTCCHGRCVNTNTSNDHCSACDRSCNGETCCSGECKDTTDDTANCGACGMRCPGVLPYCNSGVCGKTLL